MADTPNPEVLSLKRIRVRNLRRIKGFDAEIPATTKILCLVGTNGSGKSSLQSWLIQSLCNLTQETGPDLPPKGGFPSPPARDSKNDLTRSISTSEVGPARPAYALRLDWSLHGQPASFFSAVRKHDQHVDVQSLFPGLLDDLPAKLAGAQWARFDWSRKSQDSADPVARSVFLVRPAERYETASYEEPKGLASVPLLGVNWENERPLPIRVRHSGIALESLLLEILLSSAYGERFANALQRKWEKAFEMLTGSKWAGVLQSWPYRRLGQAGVGTMSGLSAGELDILVTVTQILAQQKTIAQKFPGEKFDETIGPGGFVFIDEIDSHLHPQWQERVVPLLHELFPNIFFVITTHSPFVLRSLPKDRSLVLRLPDGEVFTNEFSAWSAEDILKLVFEVQPDWSPAIKARLTEFERAVADENLATQAFQLYRELSAHDSEALRAECRRISALYGSRAFQERIAAEVKPSEATA